MNKNVTVIFNKKEVNKVLIYIYDTFFMVANIKSQEPGISDYYPDSNLVNCVVINQDFILDLNNPPESLQSLKEHISLFTPPWMVPPQPPNSL